MIKVYLNVTDTWSVKEELGRNEYGYEAWKCYGPFETEGKAKYFAQKLRNKKRDENN